MRPRRKDGSAGAKPKDNSEARSRVWPARLPTHFSEEANVLGRLRRLPRTNRRDRHALPRRKLQLGEAEVVDLDEEKYRAGEWAVQLFQTVLTPFEPTYTQLSKQLVFETCDAEARG